MSKTIVSFCLVDGAWSDWESWQNTICTKTCGTGMQEIYRYIIRSQNLSLICPLLSIIHICYSYSYIFIPSCSINHLCANAMNILTQNPAPGQLSRSRSFAARWLVMSMTLQTSKYRMTVFSRSTKRSCLTFSSST